MCRPHNEIVHRIVVIGSGFGGLFATRALKRAPVAVTLIAATNHHLFQPLLYQVATGILSSGEIAPPTREVLRRQANATVVQGEVTGLDAGARTLAVLAPDGSAQTVPYDSLIVAGGMVTSYFGNARFERYAHGMKSIDDALRLRSQIFGAFEMAEWTADPQRRAAWLTFAIVGAGPTGVELAGQIGELAHRSLTKEFRNFSPAEARILLFDGGPRILPTFPERLSAKAARALERLGVELHLSTLVADLEETAITVTGPDGERRTVTAMTRIWAAGVRAAPLADIVAQATGAAADRLGRLAVAEDCSLPGHPEIFVVGDMMALKDLPGLAEVAMQTGRHAARVIAARLAGDERPKPFRYRDLGTMAAVSRTSAVAAFGNRGFSGRIGWLAWLVVHLAFLTGFKNRFTTVVHWAITFIGNAREERAFWS
jgi:NADH:ubiquinone reductase (H+-translocating)